MTGIMFNNLNLKILSLIIAVLLWFFVIGESKTEQGMEIPVEFKGIPEAVTIVNDVPSAIHIRVKGSATLLRPLNDKPPIFSVNLSAADIGENIVLLDQKYLKNLPLGVAVVDISPVSITVVLDRIVEKRLPVEVTTVGAVPPGYVLSRLAAVPETVLVRGTRTYLEDIERIATKPVNLAEIDGRMERDVPLVFVPGRLKFIDPLAVRVTAEIREERVHRSIKGVRINFVNRPEGLSRLSFSHYFVDIQVDCPQTMLLDDIRDATVAVVNLAPLSGISGEGDLQLPVNVRLPERVLLLSANPEALEVIFRADENDRKEPNRNQE
ncbi:MAG: YbbR-like domain-containing protein [Deltaproteobacteria bacterium]|nr:YbbR-like domain-containing protein [Candidatus Anaeroferrophillacea bacterium]